MVFDQNPVADGKMGTPATEEQGHRFFYEETVSTLTNVLPDYDNYDFTFRCDKSVLKYISRFCRTFS